MSTLLRTGRGLLLELGDTNTTDSLPAGVGRVIAWPTEAADPDAQHPSSWRVGADGDVRVAGRTG